LLPLLLLLTACEGEPDPVGTVSEPVQESPAETNKSAATLSIYTVSYPLQFFAQQIGGDQVSVSFPAPVNIDPAVWAPDADVIIDYQQADLVLLNGAGYARWLQRVSLPVEISRDTSAAFANRLLPAGEVRHVHGPGGEHVHGNLAIGIWLDPELAKLQAAEIRNALAAELPAAHDSLEAGYGGLAQRLDELDARLQAAFESLSGRSYFYAQPDYQYLDRRYALDGQHLNWMPDAVPSAAEIMRVMRENNAVIIWAVEPTAGAQASLAEAGITWVVFATGASKPAEGDYFAVMSGNIDRLAALSKSSD
jgi:zinc transport system substrate-binding protein